MKQSPFPAWYQADGTFEWWVPITGQNTQLRFGQFRRLFMDTLRPARDDADKPITGWTEAGALRGQVMMGSGPRHVDVYAKHRAGRFVELVARTPANGPNPQGRTMGPVRLEVTGVRAQRLCDLETSPAMVEIPDRWDSPTTRLEVARAARAAWNFQIDCISPRPKRFAYDQNPWVWVHQLRQTAEARRARP